MRYAKDEQGKRVCIKQAIKNEVYYCPNCEEELVQRHGSVNEHCFAHKKGTECDAWGCMGEWHNAWQDSFPEENREVYLHTATETHRADVYINNIILEFQDSPISSEELHKRINFYTKKGTLIFIFNLKRRYIRVKDNQCFWTDASRSIVPPNNKNYFVILETENNLLLVNKQLSGWSRFSIIGSYTKDEFINSIKSGQFFMTIYKMQVDILSEENKKLREERELYRSYKVEAEKKELENIRVLRDTKADANKLLRAIQKEKEQLQEELDQVKAAKAIEVEKIVEKPVPQIIERDKTVYIEKEFKVTKRKLQESVILEVDRYISVAKTNADREKSYPRSLLEKRVLEAIEKSCILNKNKVNY